MADVDIDFFNSAIAKNLFSNAIQASVVKDNNLTPHPSGLYFNPIPIDYDTGLAAIPYDIAEQFGYFKLDFLSNSIYEIFSNQDDLFRCMNIEPDWNLLLNEEFSCNLFQLQNASKVLKRIQPKSINDLAICLALIRPGKSHLLYRSRDLIDVDIWDYSSKGDFKKSHAIAYAVLIVAQMNKIIELSGLSK